jgi:heme exporter protein A
VRSTLGWLGHDALCYPDLSGRENLMVACKLHGLAGDVVAQVMERFQLGAFAERPFRTYSRGQRQRVALARALLHRPKLLLLDEPTTGLDAGGVTRLRQVIEEEAARGATVLVVTHDLGFAEIGSTRLVLERGRIKKDAA